ncbi:MAG: glycoside hydrolase family 3 C-terminal domain-containing protein [Clostridiales bacterium]|nr:glycoside hydrolase family 3 C-terminal domain-containing protein [Clostridiales bacterium]
MTYHARRNEDITPSETQHMELVRRLASECVVLLKNDAALPVTKPGKIALYGNGARHTVKGGTGSGDVNSRFTVNICQGLEQAGFDIATNGWLDRYDSDFEEYKKEYMKKVTRYAKERGIVVEMALFDNPLGVMELPALTDSDIVDCRDAVFVITRDAGEGKDREYVRGDYLLTESEEAVLRKISESYENTIVLINSGGIIDTSFINSLTGVKAVMTVSQLGNVGGNIIADVITGKATPSGKLTDTWARSYEDYPNSESFSTNDDDEFYREGIYVGYRYFDSFGIEPMYPFGFGLSYTEFDLELADVRLERTAVKVDVKVTNTGDVYSGKEVVQIYVSSPKGRIDKPFQTLAAYAKTPLLAPGESTLLTLGFDMLDMAVFDDNTEMKVLEEGDYLIRFGKDSRDTEVAATVTVPHTVELEKYRRVFGDEMRHDEMTNPGKGHEARAIADSMQCSRTRDLELDIKGLKATEVRYTDERPLMQDTHPDVRISLKDVASGKYAIEDMVAQLTAEEMAYICVGAFEGERKDDSVVGSASLQVPGAAAETTKDFIASRAVPSLVLADGPAGLRLQPHFKTYADGRLAKGGYVFGFSVQPFPEDLPDDCIDYYQYCTAIPIATALAQSWNPELIEEIGRMVGEEMIEYNVHLWLAPGMNIHRNPLCGRNFEYYSEDPLISGKCAAAMTKGVQSNKGRGTTIKHYAANNQEDNRLFSNSHVSEKAMREIYLKGFEIAVKESQPLSIMTSYNLINGTHTANHFGLIQNILRDEWGYKGTVMTDWCTTQDAVVAMGFGHPGLYHESSAALCMRAGNDWIMPGCAKDVDIILKAIGDGSLDLADLQFCTYNVLKTCIICTS